MATAVKLSAAGGGAAIIDVKGLTLEGFELTPPQMQFVDRKFWGVSGVSRIYGGRGERRLTVPVLVYDATLYDTAAKLANYIDTTLNKDKVHQNGTLEITSESDHDPFSDTTFEGAAILEGPKLDVAGTLGGGYWAIVVLGFTQLS